MDFIHFSPEKPFFSFKNFLTRFLFKRFSLFFELKDSQRSTEQSFSETYIAALSMFAGSAVCKCLIFLDSRLFSSNDILPLPP